MQLKKKIYRFLIMMVCFSTILIPEKVIFASEGNGRIIKKDMLEGYMLVNNTDYYQIKQLYLIALIVFLSIMTVLFLTFYLKYVKKSKNEQLLTELNDELKRDYLSIESTYNEVSEIHKELKEQFDILKANDEKNIKLAYTDYLTELPNRNAFHKKLEQIILTLRKEETVAVMYIDLDNFKAVNDSIGHSFGDELLIDVSYRMKQIIDDNDYLAHYGGDEFMIITQNISDISEYEDKIKKLQKIFSYPFLISQKEFFITFSIGVTIAPKDGKTIQALIKNLDLAMYIAKKRGKNTYCYFDKAISERVTAKMEVQSELKKAIELEEFLVYYQPQLDLETSKVIGFEALVRWNHPEKGLIEPNTFLPIAEESGLIVPIGEFVFKESFSQLKQWMENGYSNITMAVNLSVRQFIDNNFLTMIGKLIEETGVDATHLIFEITEDIAKNDIEYTISIMEQLKTYGVKFTMDDFGKGYSSMTYLKDLSVQNLKLDKNIIDTMLDTDHDKKLVQAIINLAHILELKVVAKGIETMEQAKFLTDIECDKVQGFLYSKPLNKSDSMKFLSMWDGVLTLGDNID